MITSTIPFKVRAGRRAGFTLIELIIGMTLGSFVLLGVLTSFLMLGRSGVGAMAYSRMETQARRALEEFSQDVRMASNVAFNSNTSITLTVPNNYPDASVPANHNRVTYAFNSTAQTFYRKAGAAASTNPQTILISNVTTFRYYRFNRLDNPILDTVTTNTSTKRIQLTMLAKSTRRTMVDATNNILSSSFILRNKPAN